MTTLTARAIRKDGYWIALFEGYPTGGVSGDNLAELHEEVEAVKHFVLDLSPDTPVTVNYVYDLDEQATTAFHDYLESKAAAAKLPDAARQAAKALTQAGLTERDTAALMELSKQRVHQLKHAS